MSGKRYRSRDAPGNDKSGRSRKGEKNKQEDVLMEKTEKAILIEGLRKLSADVAQIADALEGKPEKAPDVPTEEAVAEVVAAEEPSKEEAETYSLEQVRRILADKARSGYRTEVKAILSSHGAERLSDITDPEVLSLVAKEAEVIGNG